MTRGATIPVPERSGVGRITVTEVGDHAVMLTAPMITSQFSSDGGCEMTITGPSEYAAGFMDLTCDAGAKGGVNKLRLQVVGVVGKAAVLRVGLAASDADASSAGAV